MTFCSNHNNFEKKNNKNKTKKSQTTPPPKKKYINPIKIPKKTQKIISKSPKIGNIHKHSKNQKKTENF